MSLPKRLLDGYANFRKGRYASESERYLKLGEGQQKPTIMMIACCDSRAAPETIFDAGPGEMFVVRNVANLVPPYTPDGGHHATSAALEFAVLSLGVEHLVVMGHGRCGGIRAAVGDAGPLSHTDFIGSWMRADQGCGPRRSPQPTMQPCTNAISSAPPLNIPSPICAPFPWIRMKETRKELSLHGSWFDVSMGELHAYDQNEATWQLIEV